MKILPLSSVRNLKELKPNTLNTAGTDPLGNAVNGLGKLTILQIGAGGTGGYVAAEIMRMIGGLPPILQKRINYTLVDGDTFEPKNLGRQLCTPDDIGVNKALSIVDGYSGYFGCVEGVCHAQDKYIESVNDIVSIIGNAGEPIKNTDYFDGDSSYWSNKETTIIIDCVDKTTPRSFIQKYWDMYNIDPTIGDYWKQTFEKCISAEATMRIADESLYLDTPKRPGSPYRLSKYFSGLVNNNYRTLYVISSGNGEFTGQVVLGRLCKVLGACKPVTLTDFMDELPSMPTFTGVESYTISADSISTRAILENLYASYSSKEDTNSLHRSSIIPYLDIDPSNTRTLNENIGILHSSYYNFMQHFVSSPSPYQLFPELIDTSADEKEDQLSCAERAAQNVQHINANKTASMLVINYFTTILKGLYPLDVKDSPAFTNVGVKFNCLQNAMQEIKITDSLLKSC